jgi:2-dehydro-3-deoxyphosphogluconate aldolase/(4S)-4-hydroxy-2-oxoglutarate aldolase
MQGMEKSFVLKKLASAGIVPVIRGQSQEQAFMAAEALAKGGIPVAEITMTVPDALSAVKRLLITHKDTLVVGVGTVTDTAMCKKAILTGCAFVVTPMVNPDILTLCNKAGVCVIGGGLTPTEIFNTHKAGADAVKVFPAFAMGGASYIRMLKGPFPHIPLVPTGGVNLSTIEAYLKAGALFTGAGSDLVPQTALVNGDSGEIIRRARQYVEKIASIKAPDSR